ncbi:hypothetical protein C7S13_1375 [Burkholderia cepacia]|nr:hypothetical protein [Burkholderia cepacia]
MKRDERAGGRGSSHKHLQKCVKTFARGVRGTAAKTFREGLVVHFGWRPV